MTDDSAPWIKLVLTFTGLEEGLAAELAGAIVEQSGALGAVETGKEPGRTEWALFFAQDQERAPAEEVAKSLFQQTLDEIPGQAGLGWRWETQADENWALAWREHFRPFDVPPCFRVVPPWEAPLPSGAAAIPIVINPGLGFGTGRHESTRLCLQALPGLIRSSTRVLDVGSGSGILSIASARLGAACVVAVEIDALANGNARENLQANGLAGRVLLVQGGPQAVARGVFDVVVCNMIFSSFRPLFPFLPSVVGEGGALVLSGFLQRESEAATSLFPSGEGQVDSIDTLGEWSRLIWRRV